jgi:4-hydroxy-3-methylbut-2-enyl diphosphate reductase IspH
MHQGTFLICSFKPEIRHRCSPLPHKKLYHTYDNASFATTYRDSKMDSREIISDLFMLEENKNKSNDTQSINYASEDESLESDVDEEDLDSSINSESTGIHSDASAEDTVVSTIMGK